MGLDLGAELVILSACNTAADVGSGKALGLSGLTRCFPSAGAQAVAVTHWSMPSAATLSLDVRWFEARRTILAMLDTEGAPIRHPANWGSL